MNLLFIEDDNIIRKSFRESLNTLFENVYEVSDGKYAFKKYLEIKPDIILLDINLPSIDGITIAKKIRAIDSKTLIIILSAREDTETLLDATTLSLTKYLLKPVPRKVFKNTILEAIAKIEKQNHDNKIIKLVNGFIWNQEKKVLSWNNKSIQLTKKEFLLLDNFCKKTKSIVSYEDMYLKLYNDFEFNENKLRMLIKRLRIKTHNDIIINIYGLGYKFNIIEMT